MGKSMEVKEIRRIDIENYKSVEGYKYVAMDEKVRPLIKPTTMKLTELIREKRSFKWNPEKIQKEHPYLTLAQIHSALSYYYDHKNKIDSDIKEIEKFVENYFRELGPSPIIARLKAKELI